MAPVGCGVGVIVGVVVNVSVGVAVAVGVRVGGRAHWPFGAVHTCPMGHASATQHTPSVQNPDVHCPGSVQGVPLPEVAVHTPSEPGISQRLPAVHVMVVQQVKSTQKPVLHCSADVQGVPGSLGGPHVPLLQNIPSPQLCVPQHAPSTQNVEAH
ncbi:MAG TPA: hypothetical protein VMW56_04395, partial [Candidatus Margulisiibacteriota bacterium]|nr:hypothetical protein [Candidatus Margulisiibacteriota bacterium]